MDTNEFIVLLNFLKSGFSTRELDRLLGHKNSRGWISWEILKKYGLKNTDKGKLFLYSERQCKDIIKKIVNSGETGFIDKLISENEPGNLAKYKNTYVLASTEKDFYNIFSGETRNIIRDFFNPKKKLIGKCQFSGCKNQGQIDTVHFSKDRPLIFIENAKKNIIRREGKLNKYNVYKTMRDFLKGHSKKKSVCFLCKKHHNEFHRVEKSGKGLREFKNKIEF